jgi:hypothetical protein
MPGEIDAIRGMQARAPNAGLKSPAKCPQSRACPGGEAAQARPGLAAHGRWGGAGLRELTAPPSIKKWRDRRFTRARMKRRTVRSL